MDQLIRRKEVATASGMHGASAYEQLHRHYGASGQSVAEALRRRGQSCTHAVHSRQRPTEGVTFVPHRVNQCQQVIVYSGGAVGDSKLRRDSWKR